MIHDPRGYFSCTNQSNKQQSKPPLNMWSGWWFGTWILFFHILGIIIPTDFHIFQRGRYTTNQLCSVKFNWRGMVIMPMSDSGQCRAPSLEGILDCANSWDQQKSQFLRTDDVAWKSHLAMEPHHFEQVNLCKWAIFHHFPKQFVLLPKGMLLACFWAKLQARPCDKNLQACRLLPPGPCTNRDVHSFCSTYIATRWCSRVVFVGL